MKRVTLALSHRKLREVQREMTSNIVDRRADCEHCGGSGVNPATTNAGCAYCEHGKVGERSPFEFTIEGCFDGEEGGAPVEVTFTNEDMERAEVRDVVLVEIEND